MGTGISFKINKQLRTDMKVFLSCFSMGILVIFPYIIRGGGILTLVNDFNFQQIPFNIYCVKAIHNGDVFWDWSTDLGGNFVGNYAFYTLGSPFFWLLSLFPSYMVPYLLGPLLALKYAVAGLTAFEYLRRHTQTEYSAFVGAILYAFSGFQAGNTLFNHFHDVVAFFPLLLIGLDKLTEEGEKGGFALAVALNAMTNYFFFVGEVVFLVIYFFVKIVWDNPEKIKTVVVCILEGALGIGLSCFIFCPALLAVLRGSRVTEHISGLSCFFFAVEQYANLLKSVLLPMEAMPFQSLVEANSFTSTSLYLPMVGILPVICFCIQDKKNQWIKRILLLCGIFALVPVLNSIFYAFNSSYYTRWFYMPILIMALASAEILEKEQIAVGKAFVIHGMMYLLLLIVLCNPFDKKNFLIYKFRAFLLFSMALCGIMITIWLLYRKNNGRPWKRAFIAGVISFSIVTNSYVILVMRDTAPAIHSTAGIKALCEAADKIEISDLNEDWRVMCSSRGACLPVLMHTPSVNSWNSTVSGGIFRFYSLLGGNREFESPCFGISSEPAKALLSVKYEILSNEEPQRWEGEDKAKKLLAEYDTMPFEVRVYEKGFGMGKVSQYTNQYKFYLYENENFLPIGFVYDFYMTEEELLDLTKEKRQYALLRAIILDEKSADSLSEYVQHIPEEKLLELDEDNFITDLEKRRRSSSSEFSRDTREARSTIISEEKGIAFFSIPYEYSWKAYVNGKNVKVLDSAGMIGIPVEAGENEIILRYTAMDNVIGFGITVISGLLLVVYLWREKVKVQRLRHAFSKETDIST